MGENYEVRFREDPQASHSIRVSYPPDSCTYLFTHNGEIIDTENILTKSHGYNKNVLLNEVPEEVISKVEEKGYKFE